MAQQNHVDDDIVVEEVQVWGANLEPVEAIAGTLLGVAAITFILMLAGVVEITFNAAKLSVIGLPAIAVAILLGSVFLLIQAKPVTRTPKTIQRKKGPDFGKPQPTRLAKPKRDERHGGGGKPTDAGKDQPPREKEKSSTSDAARSGAPQGDSEGSPAGDTSRAGDGLSDDAPRKDAKAS